MAKYKIPEQFQPGFPLISELSLEQISILNSVINKTSSTHSDTIVKELVGSLTLKRNQIRQLISTIFSLVNLLVDGRISIDDLAVDMAESYQSVDESFSEKKENFIKNFKKIFEDDRRLKIIIKTDHLLSSYEKIFVGSRILSDIRIVFKDNLNEKDQSAVVVHQLSLQYEQDGSLKNFFFALDGNDLRKLKIDIDRTIEKEEHIRSGLYFDNLNFLETSNS